LVSLAAWRASTLGREAAVPAAKAARAVLRRKERRGLLVTLSLSAVLPVSWSWLLLSGEVVMFGRRIREAAGK
jgi:hypothetical protein